MKGIEGTASSCGLLLLHYCNSKVRYLNGNVWIGWGQSGATSAHVTSGAMVFSDSTVLLSWPITPRRVARIASHMGSEFEVLVNGDGDGDIRMRETSTVHRRIVPYRTLGHWRRLTYLRYLK